MRKYHHAIAKARGTAAEAEDLGLHTTMSHHDTITAQDMWEDADSPNHLDMRMTMKMMKSRWGIMLYP
jgi:hypothetical protein